VKRRRRKNLPVKNHHRENHQESPPREPLREPEEVPKIPEEHHPTTIVTTPAEDHPEGPPTPAAEPTTGTVSCITIAYPLQNSLECPHCTVHYPGEGLEDLCKHLKDSHPHITQDWNYLCAFCANRMDKEEDIITHLL